MPRYIDADKLADFICSVCGDKDCDRRTVYCIEREFTEECAKKMPTVDAEPVRHGHWCVTQAYPHTVYCSECFKRFAQAHWAVWEDGSLPRDYCPNCGAKMDDKKYD